MIKNIVIGVVALLLLAICNIALQHRGEHFHAALHGGPPRMR